MDQAINPDVNTQTGEFKLDVEGIRCRARRDDEGGAVTEGYHAYREAVLRLLNEALATATAR